MVRFVSGCVGPGMDSFGARTPDEEREIVDSELEVRPIDAFRRFYATPPSSAPRMRCAPRTISSVSSTCCSRVTCRLTRSRDTFIRDTIADVEALEISSADRERVYEGNARELLRVPTPGLGGE
jgi:uncharacterized protein